MEEKKIIKYLNDSDSKVELMRQLINSKPSSYQSDTEEFDEYIDGLKSFRNDYEIAKIRLHESLSNLLTVIRFLAPIESGYLQSYLSALAGPGEINPYDFGGLQALVHLIRDSLLKRIEQDKRERSKAKRIFISHSSKDKRWVQEFIDKILVRGCCINSNQIFCTSIEANGIKTGNDLRKQLKEHLIYCEVVILLISDNYKESPICLNEMGASWILDKTVIPILFPANDYEDLGWLYEISKGMKLDNDEQLDELRDDMITTLKLKNKIKTSEWTRLKKDFINSLPKIIN